MLHDDIASAPATGSPNEQGMLLLVTHGEGHDASGPEPAPHDVERVARHFKIFGERVQAIRQARGWSIRELGRRSRIVPSTVCAIEAGRKNLTLEVFRRLADTLQVHWADLLDDRAIGAPESQPTPTTFEQQLTAFGYRVYQERVLQRLTQRALAARSGVNRNTIFAIERGTEKTRLEIVARLAIGLAVHWADLLDDRQNRPQLQQALEDASKLRHQLEQVQSQLTVALTRAEIAEHAAEQRTANRIAELQSELDRQRTQFTLAEQAAEQKSAERIAELQTQLDQVHTQLTLAQASAEEAQRVAEQKAATLISNALHQTERIVDQYDHRLLTALRPSQLTLQLDARRTLYAYLDQIWHDGPRTHLDHRPEWAIVEALRALARHLMTTVLDVQLSQN